MFCRVALGTTWAATSRRPAVSASNRCFRLLSPRSASLMAAAVLLLAASAGPAAAQDTYIWSTTTTSRAWLNTSNWTGGVSGHFPGNTANGPITSDGTSADIAQIGRVSLAGSEIGINFGNSANSGVG